MYETVKRGTKIMLSQPIERSQGPALLPGKLGKCSWHFQTSITQKGRKEKISSYSNTCVALKVS